MYELIQLHYGEVVSLFEGYLIDPMLYATLEGTRGGRVFVDHQVSPQAVFVWTGSECAYVTGGEDDGKFQQTSRRLVLEEIIPTVESLGRDYLSLFSFPDTHPARLEGVFKDRMPIKTKVNTFSFVQESPYGKSEPLNSLPEGFDLRRLSKQELSVPGNESLKEEIEIYWGSIDRFDDIGCGFCVLERDRIISCCYVQAYGGGSQTIDVWTDPNYRLMGLGSAVVSAVIAEAGSRGYTPFWLCYEGNPASRRLAEKVGFKYVRDVELVDIPFKPFDFYRGLARNFLCHGNGTRKP